MKLLLLPCGEHLRGVRYPRGSDSNPPTRAVALLAGDYPLMQAMKLAFDRASGADGFYG
jgi:hypothetical protein